MVTLSDFLEGIQNHADGDCSHEIKRRFLLVMTNLSSLLKSRDITLPTKVHLVKATVFSVVMTNLSSLLKSRDITLLTKFCLVKAMVFPVVMYGCEIWTTEKAERRRIDAFELWC